MGTAVSCPFTDGDEDKEEGVLFENFIYEARGGRRGNFAQMKIDS